MVNNMHVVLSKDKYKAYKDGDNNTIYVKMSDGVIIELDK